MGNFQEIEKKLTETYDYITLIGVFEYADGYISGDEPYQEMLEVIKKHLVPHGKIVIAIENRLGMKYWAGCTEDHTGRFYYPYPDYKFPLALYSDHYLPGKGELNLNIMNFDRERLELFDEGKVYDSLIDEELFPLFANSFLIVLEGE